MGMRTQKRKQRSQEAPAPSQGARQTEATLWGAGPLEQQGSQMPRLPQRGEGVPGAQQMPHLTEGLLVATAGGGELSVEGG